MRIRFVGWCRDGKHDKIWALVILKEGDQLGIIPTKCATFWGRRGKSLRCKIFDVSGPFEYQRVIREKLNHGYKDVTNDYDNVYPELLETMKKSLSWALLGSE